MAKRKFNLTKEDEAKFKAAYQQSNDGNLSKKLLAVRYMALVIQQTKSLSLLAVTEQV